MLARHGRASTLSLALWAGLTSLAAPGCGARTDVVDPDAGSCTFDDDCQNGLVCDGPERCLAGRCHRGEPLDCDDHDPCTRDGCLEESDDAGRSGCVHEVLRVDGDGDGYDALLEEAGGACGDDCQDDDPEVHPGALERCNGRDDDCDGQIDEGASYMPEARDVRLTTDEAASSYGGVAWNPLAGSWGATYWDYGGGSADVSFVELDAGGHPVGEPKLLTHDAGDAFGANIVWTGREFGVVWQDRRDGDYEVYFNRLAPDGEKLAADYRLTYSPGWSINTALAWTGSEFVVAWQDGRHEVEAPENFEIYLTFLDRDGFEIGDDIRLTDDLSNSEAPAIALGGGEIGVAFLDGRDGEPAIWFAATDLTGARVLADTRVSAPIGRTRDPVVAFADGAFVVVWEQESPAGDADVLAARVPRDPPGPVEGPLVLAGGDAFARGPSVLSNGDRVVVAYADDREGGFDLWASVFDARLGRLGPDTRVTSAPGDSVYPQLARGATSIGVLFNDQRDGNWEVYFTRLLCVEPE